jgi:hypothetical protein
MKTAGKGCREKIPLARASNGSQQLNTSFSVFLRRGRKKWQRKDLIYLAFLRN